MEIIRPTSRKFLLLTLFTGLLACQSIDSSKLQALRKFDHAAWFTKSTLDHNSIKICIINKSDYPDTDKLTLKIKDTFNKWIQYIDLKKVEKNNAKVAFIRNLTFLDKCDNTDLTVIFAPHDSQALDGVEPELSYASVFPKIKTMWITNHSASVSNEQKGEWRTLNYKDPYMLSLVLLHEWGHIFGNRHIPGTIMDESILSMQIEALKEAIFLNKDQREFMFSNLLKIDFTRELYFSDPLKFSNDLISPPDFQNKYDVKLVGLGDNTALLSSESMKFHHLLYNIENTEKKLPLPHWADAEVFIRQGSTPLFHQSAEIKADVYGLHAQTRISRNVGAVNMPHFFISYKCPEYTKHAEACRRKAGDWLDGCLRALKYQIFYYSNVTESMKTEGIFNKDFLSNWILKTMIVERTCGEFIDNFEEGRELRYPSSTRVRNRLARLQKISLFDLAKYQGPRRSESSNSSADGSYIKLKSNLQTGHRPDSDKSNELCSFPKDPKIYPIKEICTYKSKATGLMYLYIKDRSNREAYIALKKISRNINASLRPPVSFTEYEAKIDFDLCRNGYRYCDEMKRLFVMFGQFPDETSEKDRRIILYGQMGPGQTRFGLDPPMQLCPRSKAMIECY